MYQPNYGVIYYFIHPNTTKWSETVKNRFFDNFKFSSKELHGNFLLIVLNETIQIQFSIPDILNKSWLLVEFKKWFQDHFLPRP